MHIIIVGCGKVGSKFAEVMSNEGHGVVIIDNDRDSFDLLGSNFNGVTIVGVPIDQDVLKQAGIESADFVAAVTPDDNVNVMVSEVAKEIFKVPKVIARIYNPSREHVFREFGVETICPTELTVEVMRSRILDGNCISSHFIGCNKITFRNEKVQKKLEGKNIERVTKKQDETVFGIMRDNSFEFADKSIILAKGDILVIAQKNCSEGI